MDELKIKHLLARHCWKWEMDKLLLHNRIKAEHWFLSIDECLEYLKNIVRVKTLNPDNILFKSYQDSPILVINIIDEAVCSIIYEAYQQVFRRNPDMLEYMRIRLDEFKLELANTEYDEKDVPYYASLLVMIDELSKITDPTMVRKYTVNTPDLSKAYYTLMFALYNTIEHPDQYDLSVKEYYRARLIDKGEQKNVPRKLKCE